MLPLRDPRRRPIPAVNRQRAETDPSLHGTDGLFRRGTEMMSAAIRLGIGAPLRDIMTGRRLREDIPRPLAAMGRIGTALLLLRRPRESAPPLPLRRR